MLIQVNPSCALWLPSGAFRDFMRKSDSFANLWFSTDGSFAIRTSVRMLKPVTDERMFRSPGRGGERLP